MHSAMLLLGLIGMAAGCVPPDCDRPDCGTCGVACCTVRWAVQASVVQLMQSLNGSLASGGPDGRFFLKPTAEDKYGAPSASQPSAHFGSLAELPLTPNPQARRPSPAGTRTSLQEAHLAGTYLFRVGSRAWRALCPWCCERALKLSEAGYLLMRLSCPQHRLRRPPPVSPRRGLFYRPGVSHHQETYLQRHAKLSDIRADTGAAKVVDDAGPLYLTDRWRVL